MSAPSTRSSASGADGEERCRPLPRSVAADALPRPSLASNIPSSSPPSPIRHVYLHVPFCTRRCSYCDFSIAVRRDVPVGEFLGALEAELRAREGEESRPSPVVETLYLGGGTPSKLGGAGVARVLDLLRERHAPGEGAEVTLEANPEDVTAEAARAWVAAGVTRVSLGVQSFDPAVLGWMHRTHAADAAERAAGTLREAGIGSLSLDLIFALPQALGRDLESDVHRLLALAPEHVSLYGLTVEGGTPLGRWVARGETVEQPEEGYARDYLLADRLLSGAGFDHYEVSNYSRPGHRARHNSAYWLGVPYLGLGPAAHGFDGVERRWNARHYAQWLARTRRGEDPVEGRETLTPENRLAESVYLGLRTQDGLALEALDRPLVERWVAARWAQLGDDSRVRLTPEGWLRLDALAAALTHHRSH